MSVTDAAAYTSLSRSTLYRLSALQGQGPAQLPVVVIGGRRLFLRTDLDAFLTARRPGGDQLASRRRRSA